MRFGNYYKVIPRTHFYSKFKSGTIVPVEEGLKMSDFTAFFKILSVIEYKM